MSRPELERAVLARNGRREGEEIRFQCPHPDRHTNGDANPSARYHMAKDVWGSSGTPPKREDGHPFLGRQLEQLAPERPYPQGVDRPARITGQVRAMTGERPTVFVDSTGVGRPVVDLLRERVKGGRIVPVTFTAGDRRAESWADGYLRVSLGRSYMVSRLQAMLGSARLHLPRTREAGALTEELLNYEQRVDENANDRYGAFKVGTHDDLVTALGLAVQSDQPPWRLRSGAAHRPICW